MARGRLVIHENSFILSTLSCSGTLQMMLGAGLLKELGWKTGILSILLGFGTVFASIRAAEKIPALPAAKKTFTESLLAFFAGVLTVSGGLSLLVVGSAFGEEGMDYGIMFLLSALIFLIPASAIFEYLKFRRWIRYLKIMGVIEDLPRSETACREVYNTYPRRKTLNFIRKHNPGSAEQIKTSRGKEKTTGTAKSAEEDPEPKEDLRPMMAPVSRDAVFPEKSAGLRLRDLFVYNYGTDDIHVMRILNLDHYFAFTGFFVDDTTKMYYLNKKQRIQFFNSKLKEEDLLNDTAGWESLRTIEQRYSAKDLDDFIESAVRKGMTLQDMCRYCPDYFLNYGAMQDIRLVRMIDREQYFAVLPASKKDMYHVMLRPLEQEEVHKIGENRITRYELLGKRCDWVSAEDYFKEIDRKTRETFAADAENAGLTLREYLEKRAFPAGFGGMEKLYKTQMLSDFVKLLKSHSKEMTAAKRRTTIAAVLLAAFGLYGCLTPVMFPEREMFLLLMGIELFYVAVILFVYFLAEQGAFKKILKRMEAKGVTEDRLENSYRACDKLYWEYPRRITLRYIKKRNPQAAQKILASRKKK